jgi:hypothetical protein
MAARADELKERRRALVRRAAEPGRAATALLDLASLLLDLPEGSRSIPGWIRRRLHLLSEPPAEVAEVLAAPTDCGLSVAEAFDLLLIGTGERFAFGSASDLAARVQEAGDCSRDSVSLALRNALVSAARGHPALLVGRYHEAASA